MGYGGFLEQKYPQIFNVDGIFDKINYPFGGTRMCENPHISKFHH